MIGLNERNRYFLYQKSADMRKSFTSLSGLVLNEMKGDLLSGDVFVFINKSRTHIKLLFWESGGFWIYHKRLEKGRFELPEKKETSFPQKMEISMQKLMFIIQGISLKSVKKRKRFILKKNT